MVSRRWGTPALRSQVLKYGVGSAAFLGLFSVGALEFDHAREAQEDARVAVVHAAVDGRAGPVYNPTDIASTLDPPLADQDLTPAESGNASSAVTADQVRAEYSMELAAQTQENARWLWGGAAVVVFAMARTAYVDVSRTARASSERHGGSAT